MSREKSEIYYQIGKARKDSELKPMGERRKVYQARWRAKHTPEKLASLGRKYKNKLRAKVFEAIGDACRCCGAPGGPGRHKRLEVDHVVSTGRARKNQHATYQDAIKNPSAYQPLCGDCNRWKDNGPCCPCHWWDTVSPGWRGYFSRGPST